MNRSATTLVFLLLLTQDKRDTEEIFRLQNILNGLQAKKDDAELELSYDKQFEFKGQEGVIHDKDIDAYMKRKAKLEADRVLCHTVYKGAMLKDLTEQAELRSEWEPIRDDIKHVVDLILLMQDITEGKKSDLTITFKSKNDWLTSSITDRTPKPTPST